MTTKKTCRFDFYVTAVMNNPATYKKVDWQNVEKIDIFTVSNGILHIFYNVSISGH